LIYFTYQVKSTNKFNQSIHYYSVTQSSKLFQKTQGRLHQRHLTLSRD